MEALKSPENKAKVNSKAIIGILVFSAFIATFNETILNVALNPLMNEMKVTAGTVQWLITAYMIVTSVMVPVTAFLIQTFKTKKLYLGAMTILLVGTICAAMSGSFQMLLVSRMLQAAGTGMMIPIMMNVVMIVAPEETRGIAMGACVCAISLGPAFGPTVSGIILQVQSWHVLFIMLIPIIIITMLLAYFKIENVTKLTKPKIDIFSIFLSTIGIGGIIYGISSFTGAGNKLITAVIFIVGLLAVFMFCRRQFSLKEPMLEIRTFKYPIFSVGVLLVMICMMTMFTMNVMLPMFLEGALKTSTFVAALILLPASLANGITTPIAGKIYDKFGVKLLLPIGFVIIGAAVFLLARCNSATSIFSVMLMYVFVCIGVGLTMSPSQTNSLSQLPQKDYPHGVAIMNTFQQISAAIGSSLFVGIMSSTELKALSAGLAQNVAVANGFKAAALATLIFVIIGFLLTLSVGLKMKKTK